jgi:hypothetical protein
MNLQKANKYWNMMRFQRAAIDDCSSSKYIPFIIAGSFYDSSALWSVALLNRCSIFGSQLYSVTELRSRGSTRDRFAECVRRFVRTPFVDFVINR